jgi:hypothetical protein
LESIDWSRKNRSGMRGRVVAVTSEMEGRKEVEPKDIAALDEQELRTHAPLLVKEIEEKAKEPLTTKIGEMETAATATAPAVETVGTLREKLGLDENGNVVESVVELLEKVEGVARKEIRDYVDKAIEKLAGKNERAQRIVRRLVGEMESDYEGTLDDDMKAKIDADLTKAVEEDEDVKAVIGEMSSEEEIPTGGRALGGRSARPEGSPTPDNEGIIKDTENLTVRKRA